MRTAWLGLLAAVSLMAPLLATPSANACSSQCTQAPWQAPQLLTETVPNDLGPLLLLRRGCKTPLLSEITLALSGPNGAVAGKTKELDSVPAISDSALGHADRDGRIVVGFLPDAALTTGATYELAITLGTETTKVPFTATEAIGALAAPALSAPVVPKAVPTQVCCQGASGCGGGSDPDPQPVPKPVTETVPPAQPGFQCHTIATVDRPEALVSFPLAQGTKKSFFDYRLYDEASDQLIARFSGRRITSAAHAVRLVPGEDRCFRLEMDDLLRGGSATTKACTGAASVPEAKKVFCEGLEMYATCKAANVSIIEAQCSGAAGAAAQTSAGAAGQPGGGAASAAQGPNAATPSEDGCSIGSPGTASGGLLGVALGLTALGAVRRSRRARDRASIGR